jgi:hypothetical protein
LPTIAETLPTTEVAKDNPRQADRECSRAGVNSSVWSLNDLLSEPPSAYDSTTYLSLLALTVLWAFLFHKTWATWGSVTIDSGREMYVPAALAQGKTLYRDLSYPYPPLAPYFNAVLFRLFGIHLEVLYWAGSLSALGSAVLLFFTGARLSFRLAGLAAGAVLLFEAFRQSLFSFPLPYSYSAVYGCLIACVFSWSLVHATTSKSHVWRFAAATAAGAALLLKLEFGAACYGALALLIASECLGERSWKKLWQWLAAATPAAAACCAVAAWMMSLRGADFITHENFDSWPSSYFMRQYGKLWLKMTGFDLSAAALKTAATEILWFLCAAVVLRWIFRRMEGSERRLLLWIVLLVIGVIFVLQPPSQNSIVPFHMRFWLQNNLDVVAFPPAMAVLVLGAAAWRLVSHNRSHGQANATIAIFFTFAGVLPFRALFQTKSYGQAIYYDGPEILCMLIMVSIFVAPPGTSKRLRSCATILISALCLVSTIIDSNVFLPYFDSYVPLVTDRGTIRLPKGLKENYAATIAFMKQNGAKGESTLSIPDDASLYFFSGTESPSRVLAFVPGVVAPGKMTSDVIAQLDMNKPRFLIWSNKQYPGYGAPQFGTDFDVPVGDYLRANYRPIGHLMPADPTEWNADIWERDGNSDAH